MDDVLTYLLIAAAVTAAAVWIAYFRGRRN